MPENPQAWRFRTESTSMERLEGETILIDFSSGQFYSFRRSAADVAWLIDNGLARAEWSSVLANVFPGFVDDEATNAEIDAFVQKLSAAGLIEETPPRDASSTDLPQDYERTTWAPPSIAVNDTLSDLLAIDPIHDVSDDGWPETRQL